MERVDKFSPLNFINRLRSLQWICSESDKNCPKALLFIPGPDGRHNPGSVCALKYLFGNAVGKHLFDDTFDGEFEALEDVVVLIKESSVSIIASEQMKKVLNPLLALIPQLVLYGYAQEEFEDIDKFQYRKCFNFKKMILEALGPEDGVGICVPVGYEDILDVENWPLLQSFALDSLLASTGFFTARHAVADITSNMDVLFRSVDCSYVEQAMQLTRTVIRPHVLELISLLDTNIPSQRKKMTANDVVGPLEVLYDFGELDAAGSLEKVSPPIVLLGGNTTQIGTLQQMNGAATIAWKEQAVGESLHLVFEGCEPSTGMRFCRSYFLRHGTADKLVRDAKQHYKELLAFATAASAATAAATAGADDEKDGQEEDFADFVLSAESEDVSSPSFLQSLEDVQRLMSLYVKLWFALRVLVHDLFLSNQDVLSAATELQRRLNEVLRGNNLAASANDEVAFLLQMPGQMAEAEKLQLHIDCMNALGEIVTLEDVQDMGGVCWVYVRATINGIVTGYGLRKQGVAVAVGDTFLFSPLVKPPAAEQAKLKEQTAIQALIPHLTDCACITANVPYFISFNGGGVEEDYRRLVQFLLKNQELVSPLRLGKPLEFKNGARTVPRMPCFLDYHPLPSFEADIQCFTSGFIIDRIARVNHVPVAVSFERHVAQIWITDTAEWLAQANATFFADGASDAMMALHTMLDGYVITFELRDDAALQREAGEGGVTGEGSIAVMNPMQRLFLPLPHSPTPRLISLFVRYGEDGNARQSFAALDAWKNSFRRLDVPVLAGKKHRLPDAVLKGLLVYTDNLIAKSGELAGDSSSGSCREMIEVLGNYCSSFGVPGKAQVALRTMHALAEARRLSPFNLDESSLKPQSSTSPSMSSPRQSLCQDRLRNSTAVVMVVGCPGSGLRSVHDLLQMKLRAALPDWQIVDLEINFAAFSLDHQAAASGNAAEIGRAEVVAFLESTLQQTMKRVNALDNKKMNAVVFTTVTLSPLVHIKTSDLCILLTCLLRSPIASVASVLCSDLFLEDRGGRDLVAGLGGESWLALSNELLHAASADTVFVVEPSSSSPSYTKLREGLELSNPHATVLRVHPYAPALVAQDLEPMVTAIQASISSTKPLSEREAQMMALGYPSPQQALQHIGSDLRCLDFKIAFYPRPREISCIMRSVRITISSGGGSGSSACAEERKHWAIGSLLTMFAALFPTAKGGTYRIKQQWELGMSTGAGADARGFERLVKIASLRVLAQRQEKAIGGMDARLKEIAKQRSAAWMALKHGILSVEGTAMLKGETIGSSADSSSSQLHQLYQLVRMEANHSFVAASEIASNNNSNSGLGETDALLVHGVFTLETVELMREIVSLCEKRRLPRQRILSTEDIDAKKKHELQMMRANQDRPLPTGWWYDGHHYINFHGATNDFRPDMNEIVEEYVAQQNKKACRYNDQLDEMGY